MDISNKTILITGASSGIGRELAYRFSQYNNVNLILVARRKEALDKVAVKCMQNNNVEVKTYSVDMGEKTEVDNLMDKLPYVDILINAAGYGELKEFDDFNDEQIVRMFDVNVFGTIQLTMEVAKKMKLKKEGTIVTIASLLGKISTPKSSVYSATKYALLGYFNSLRLELKDNGINVITVNPGPVATNFFNVADDKDKTYLKSLGNKTITPQMVAKKIVVAIEKNKREVNIPFKLSFGAKLNNLFPKLGDKIITKMFK